MRNRIDANGSFRFLFLKGQTGEILYDYISARQANRQGSSGCDPFRGLQPGGAYSVFSLSWGGGLPEMPGDS